MLRLAMTSCRSKSDRHEIQCGLLFRRCFIPRIDGGRWIQAFLNRIMCLQGGRAAWFETVMLDSDFFTRISLIDTRARQSIWGSAACMAPGETAREEAANTPGRARFASTSEKSREMICGSEACRAFDRAR